MAKEVKIILSNKLYWTLIAISMIFIFIFTVAAISPSIDLTKGYHESAQVNINVSGTEKTLQEAIDDGSIGGSEGFRGAYLTLNTARLIPSSTYVKIIWDGESYDTDGIFDPSNPTRLTVPAGVSKIRLQANSHWDDNRNNGVRFIRIMRNTGAVVASDQRSPNDGLWTNCDANIISPVINVNPGDYFELEVFQSQGSAINFKKWMPFFSMEIIE